MNNFQDQRTEFASVQEENAYLRKRLEEYQNELEEFQESSRELEAELEAQLSQSEKRNQELVSQNTRLQNENESLKTKLNKLSTESQSQILELQKELTETTLMNERLSRCIRELEQSNDDLERAKRALDASLADFESRLNHQIERNVLLENEIGEKEELQVVVQRLKDEARDLRSELVVRENVDTPSKEGRKSSLIPHKTDTSLPTDQLPADNSDNGDETTANDKIRSNSVAVVNTETQTNGTPIKQTRLNFGRSSSQPTSSWPSGQSLPLLSPSSRISALNIVSDLLRKVGALESKLASCRNITTPSPARNNNIKSNPTTPMNSPSCFKDINAN